MLIEQQIENAKFVLSKDEIGYREVLDSFRSTKEIHILTFNISSRRDALLEKLKTLDSYVLVHIITNIPQRYENYRSEGARERARENIKIYMRKLLPAKFESQVIPFFNFNNHAKIITTDRIAYVGSANFSDESENNFESGFIIKDKSFIDFLKEKVFPTLINDSEPYFEDAFTEYKLFVLNLFSRLSGLNNKFFTWGFYVDDEEFGSYYETNHSDFMIGATELEDFEIVLYELQETISRINDLFAEVDNDDPKIYKIENLKDIVDNTKILRMLELIEYDSNIFCECNFNYQKFCEAYLEDHALLADEEHLDNYAERASVKASEFFEQIALEARDDINELQELCNGLLGEILDFIKELRVLSDVNSAIDNTI